MYYENNFIFQKCNHTHAKKARFNWQTILTVCLMLFLSVISAQQSQTHYYYIEEASYDLLKHSITGLSYNYVFNSTNSNQFIPVDQLPQGTYIVNVVANGDNLDTKNLIIN